MSAENREGSKPVRRVSNPPVSLPPIPPPRDVAKIAAEVDAALTLPPMPMPPAQAAPAVDSSGFAQKLAAYKQHRTANLDALTTALTLAEQAINEQELRIPDAVEIGREDDDGSEVVHYLEYMRDEKDGWGLYVTAYYDGEEFPVSTVRLTSAPRVFRLAAVDMLDELWARLMHAAHAEDLRVQMQAERAAQFVERLTGKKAGA